MPETDRPSYRAVALQAACHAVNACRSRAESQPLIDGAIDRMAGQIKATIGFFGPSTKLVVLPEYIFTGFPMGEPAAAWIEKACIRIPGPEIARMAAHAKALDVWIAGNSYEADPEWPGRYFQACWLVGPDEQVALKYRRLNSLFTPSPHDFWTDYLRRYTLHDVFPVADTPLGRLAAIASEEILFPELARCLMMHGAEVFLHSTSDIGGHPRNPKEVAKLARAYENAAYVISANTAGVHGTPMPAQSADGRSKVVDYAGVVLAEADQGESMVASAVIDLGALRRHRRQTGMSNLVARQRFELYAPMYASHTFTPPDQAREPIRSRAELLKLQEETIARLIGMGVIQ
ncbi:MAG: nitrilase-related carbon-nitrogen hydrolase [Vicinamibacterales bacterium]